MHVACPFYLPAGVVRETGSDLCVVVAKLTFALDGSGWGRLAPVQEPLSGNQSDPGGRLLYPSDFGPQKQACDVVVVGSTLGGRATPLRLRVGRLKKQVEKPSMLGAIGRRGPDGAFASADQRMPFPSLPLELSLERSGGALVGALPGPVPSAALIYQNEWRAQYPVALAVDGVLLDPTRSLCMLTLRGSFRHAGDQLSGLLLVVNPTGNPRTPPELAASWPQYSAETPPPEPETEELPLERGRGETVRLERPHLPALGAPIKRGTQRFTRGEVLAPRAAGLSRNDDDETTQVGRPIPAPPDSPTGVGRPIPVPPDSPTGTFTLPTRAADVDFDSTDPVDANPTLSMPAVTSDVLPDAEPVLQRSKAMTADAQPHDPGRDTMPFDRPMGPPPPPKPIVFGERPVAPVSTAPQAATPVARQRSQTVHGRVDPGTGGAALPFAPPPPAPPSSQGALAGGLPFQAPRPPTSSSGLPFVGGPKASEPPPARRAMMTVGLQGTPLAYPPTPFANAKPGASSPPPPAEKIFARPASSAPPPPIVAPPPSTVPPAPPAAPAVPFGRPEPAIAPPAFEIPSYARRSFAAHVPEGPSRGGYREEIRTEPEAQVPVKRIEGLSLEEVARLRSELWSQPEARRAILRGHGLSELRWRIVERAWAAELEIMFEVPTRAGEAVIRMRSAAGTSAAGAPSAPSAAAG